MLNWRRPWRTVWRIPDLDSEKNLLDSLIYSIVKYYDEKVLEYAMSRTVYPMMVAEYKLRIKKC